MEKLRRYYEILDVVPGANLQEIKKAYRDAISVWHPDRFANNPKLQQKAQEKLKDINEAHDKIYSFFKEYGEPVFSSNETGIEGNKSGPVGNDDEELLLRRNYCSIVGKNNAFYVERFIKFKKKMGYSSWNWAAFLFCIPWTIYRKMYMLATMFIAIYAFWLYATFRILEISKINPNVEEELYFLMASVWCCKALYGIFANAVYFYHIERKTKQRK
ncbi:DnaJ domain-containing protein [Oryzomonas japonica]|uniref:DnaJ domain-containing protein n=1 Tax=Oryzomonas japonica TaxID=2603858 RepID=A0A7J4ZN13_9BACT|nr:J domain-containing protein [Oryzomonas japonica]KAB0664119.1 DnaJ domain-containing protein [Oryzomonas japonica]